MRWQTRIVAVLTGLIGLVACAVADNSTTLKTSEPPAKPSASDNVPTVVMGYCHPVANGHFDPFMADSTLDPNIQAKRFLNYEEHYAVNGTTNTSILMEPKHGALHKVSEADKGKYYRESVSLDPAVSYYIYLPGEGYTGKDSATFLVDFGTVRVKLIYFFQVTDENMISECDTHCDKQRWEISSTLHSDNDYKSKQGMFAVVLKDYTTTETDSNPLVSFSSGSVVAYDQISDDGKIHVVYPWGRYAWIPRGIVATKNQFVRITSWKASTSKDESIDNTDTYVFHEDGSFETTYSGECGIDTVKGHLYRFKNVLWMRDEHDNGIPPIRSFSFLPSAE